MRVEVLTAVRRNVRGRGRVIRTVYFNNVKIMDHTIIYTDAKHNIQHCISKDHMSREYI